MEGRKEYQKGKFLPVFCEDIPEGFLLKARKKINETPEKIEEGLIVLRKYIESEKLNMTIDENVLLMYLRQAKFDFKRAKEKLRNSLKFYKMVEDLIQSCGIEKIKVVMENNFAGILPFRDAEGSAILFGRADVWKKELFDLNDGVATLCCLSLFASKNPLTSLCGYSYIADSKVESFLDLIPIAKTYVKFLPYLKCLPFRIQRADGINSGFSISYFWAILGPFIPSKLRNRVFLSAEFEHLKEAYPPCLIPNEFGGTLGPINCDSYKEQFFEFVANIKSELRANSN